MGKDARVDRVGGGYIMMMGKGEPSAEIRTESKVIMGFAQVTAACMALAAAVSRSEGWDGWEQRSGLTFWRSIEAGERDESLCGQGVTLGRTLTTV